MIIMNDDDENDNNERPTHPLASEIQGQLCQALESTMRAHLCVRMSARLSRRGHLAVIVPLILPRSTVYLFIYLCIHLFAFFKLLRPLVLVSSRKPPLCVAILQSGGVALCAFCSYV